MDSPHCATIVKRRETTAKNEIAFALMWIAIYGVAVSLGDELSRSLGVEKGITLPVLATLSCMLLIIVREIMGASITACALPVCLPRSSSTTSPSLSCSRPHCSSGFSSTAQAVKSLLYRCNAVRGGFLEELIVHGPLFQAMRTHNRDARFLAHVQPGAYGEPDTRQRHETYGESVPGDLPHRQRFPLCHDLLEKGQGVGAHRSPRHRPRRCQRGPRERPSERVRGTGIDRHHGLRRCVRVVVAEASSGWV